MGVGDRGRDRRVFSRGVVDGRRLGLWWSSVQSCWVD